MSADFYRKIELLEPKVREAFLALAEHLESIQRTELHMKAISAGMERLANAQADTEVRVGRLEAALERLAQAQAQTEERMARLETALEQLAQAQARTEERVGRLEAALQELAQAQARTEERVGRLEVALQELAQAQARTEKRLEELAQAQARTEKRLEELAQAQARTERRLEKLIGEHGGIRKQLGGLSAAVGYGLEDKAFKALPDLLCRDYGLEVLERLRRGYLRDNEGEMLEVNILGKARRDGREILIVGEAKSQLSKEEVNRFLRRKLARLKGIGPELFPVLVTYMTTSAGVEEYVREKGLALYYSFDF